MSYLGALIDIHVRLSPSDRLVVQIANREGGFAPEVGQIGSCRLAGAGRPGVQRVNAETSMEAIMSNRLTSTRRACSAAGGARRSARLPAAAQDNKSIIVGTWGGDYSRLLAKNIDTPLLVPKGWECVHAEENVDPRKAKMLAEKLAAPRHVATCRACRPTTCTT